MANIRLFSTSATQSRNGFINAVVQFDGEFTVEEWDQFQAVFHRMRTQPRPTGPARPLRLDEGCLEAEVIQSVPMLP